MPLQPLCLGITGQDCQNVTVVQSGDFCALIADNAGIDVTTLLANNPNVNSGCTNIYVGEVCWLELQMHMHNFLPDL